MKRLASHEASDGLVTAVEIAGERAHCDRSGALYLPAHKLLVVSDLHLEKGAAYARRGQMLPPYDTVETLKKLALAIATYQPTIVISLGDSFHDRDGAAAMPDIFRLPLQEMMRGRDWFWVAGNHDPAPPVGLLGDSVDEIALGNLVFRHEPSAARTHGEIAGHLHPGARLVKSGRSVRRPCFASDGSRLIMPAFGAYTGMLNVLDRAYAGLFDHASFFAYMLGLKRVYPIAGAALRPG
jgi:DNA ligase-associated metallophosphoesterase